jgi:histidine triad (HIT) family protein
LARKGSSVSSDCLFCRLFREGDHVRSGDGFVAVEDIDPRAETHLLVIPERHVPSFREIGEFPPEEAKRMVEFIAETARDAGLEDYRVVVNVGEGGGQTIFHLHWHVLGGSMRGLPG